MRGARLRCALWTGAWFGCRAGLIALLFLFNTSAAALSASVDRTEIEDGGTVQLALEVEGSGGERPDITPLQKDFEVLGTSSMTRMEVVNGRASSSTQWVVNLRPKRLGTVTIPALESGGARSQPIDIKVGEIRKSPGDTPALFLETEINPRSPYVQEQLTYTVRVYQGVALQSGQLSEPGGGRALILKVGEDRNYAVTRNGRRYRVIERKYAVFPQESGELTLDGPVLHGEVADRNRRQFGGGLLNGFIGSTRPVRVRGEAQTIQVRARPPSAQGYENWLPAQSVELSGDWDSPSSEMKVGEPVTLTVKLAAIGLTGTQLADVAPKKIDGFSVYPDTADVQTTFSDQGIAHGTRTQKIAFIPRRPGELTIPDVVVRWWNTQTDREEVAVLPGITRSVLGVAPTKPAVSDPVTLSPQPSSAPAVAESAGTPDRGVANTAYIWMGVSALFALAWIVTMALWRRASRRQAPAPRGVARGSTPSSEGAQSQILQACRRDDPLATRNALLVWGAAHWRDDPPRGLDEIATRVADARLVEALRALDRALYGGTGHWKGDALAPLLDALPAAKSATSSTPRRALLPLHYAQSAVR